MKRIWFMALLACGLLELLPRVSLADLQDEEAMRCGDQVVYIGDPKYEVQTKCGKPTSVDYEADLWVYNFGPDRFVYYVTFSDDQVIRIQSDGYGH